MSECWRFYTVPTARVIFTAKTSLDVFSLSRKQVWTFSVLGDRIYELRWQQQPGIEPTNPLDQCWVPPIIAFYDQQGLLRTYSSPGGSIRTPDPVSPLGVEGSKSTLKTDVSNLICCTIIRELTKPRYDIPI